MLCYQVMVNFFTYNFAVLCYVAMLCCVKVTRVFGILLFPAC